MTSPVAKQVKTLNYSSRNKFRVGTKPSLCHRQKRLFVSLHSRKSSTQHIFFRL
eukprot:m.87374 g.87374  ORF g.87374 m.87374 type:complete len:54 (-) comp14775_c0_seq1:1382-1543(-)